MGRFGVVIHSTHTLLANAQLLVSVNMMKHVSIIQDSDICFIWTQIVLLAKITLHRAIYSSLNDIVGSFMLRRIFNYKTGFWIKVTEITISWVHVDGRKSLLKIWQIGNLFLSRNVKYITGNLQIWHNWSKFQGSGWFCLSRFIPRLNCNHVSLEI